MGWWWAALSMGCTAVLALAARREGERNCGVLLSRVTVGCGSAQHSREKWCCAALRSWNAARCWCDDNALHAAQNVAMDAYAFQLRAQRCNISTVYRTETALPNSAKRVLPRSCDARASSSSVWVSRERCTQISTSALRALRVDSLYRLQRVDLTRRDQLRAWSAQLDELFAPHGWLFSIGETFSFPRSNVKRYLLQRSSLLRGALWRATLQRASLAWSHDERHVSYAVVSAIGDWSFSRIEFAHFERCSPRLRSVVVQEQPVAAHFAQFVYVDPSDRAMWPELHTPSSWCRRAATACAAPHFPFRSLSDCVSFARHMHRHRQVTCARQGERSSVLALHGDTLSCRGMYARLAGELRSRPFCRLLSRRGAARCRRAACAPARYDDFFRTPNPRFDSTAGFECARARCRERWPRV